MTTMAAIDRVVHHSVILDLMQVESYRAEAASQRRAGSPEMIRFRSPNRLHKGRQF